MEDFDFTTPIDAIVIFDDSDDEIQQCTDIIQIDDSEATDSSSSINIPSQDELRTVNELENKTTKPETSNIAIENENSFSKAEPLESIKIKRLDSEVQEWVVVNNDKSKAEAHNHIKSQAPLDMPSLFDDDFTLQDIIDHSVTVSTQKKDIQNKSESQKLNKRQKSVSKPKIQKRRPSKKSNTIEETDKTEGIQNNSTSMEIISSAVPVATNSVKTIPESQKNNNPTNEKLKDSIGIPLNIIQNHYYQQLNTNNASQSNTANPTSSYLGELLNQVSENMIYILISYQTYSRLNKINIERSLAEHAKNNYIRTKYHFFDLSYSSVLNIIIPREKDLTFVTNFINSSIKLARSKSYPYTHLQMEPLYLEMIDWVKKRECQIISMNLNSRSSLMPNERFQEKRDMRTPLYPNSDSGETQICLAQQQSNTEFNKDGNNSCVITGKNIGLTNLTNQWDSQRNQNIKPQLKTQESFGNPMHSNTQMQQGSAYESYTHIRSLLNQTTYQQPLSNLEVLANAALPWQNHTTTVANINAKNQQEPNKQQLPNFNVLPNVTSSWQTQTTLPHAISQNYQEINKQSLPTMNKMQNNALPRQNQETLAQRFFETYQEPQLPQNNEGQQDILNLGDLNRSSISRDSGFISPPSFNSNTDNVVYCNVPQNIIDLTDLLKDQELLTVQLHWFQQCNVQEEHSPGPILISHVTSLNPNASYLIEGPCAVCGKITNKKCLGCYNCYYCSHPCQYLDWKKHMTVCK